MNEEFENMCQICCQKLKFWQKVCPVCGWKRKIECKHCGAMVDYYSLFCKSCGHELPTPPNIVLKVVFTSMLLTMVISALIILTP